MKRLTILILLLSSLISAQSGRWEIIDVMPRPVSGGEIWSHLDTLYVMGGYSDSIQSNVNWVQKFNIYDHSWNYDSMSTARNGFVVDGIGDNAYIYGGVQTESNSLAGIEIWKSSFIIDGVFTYNNNFNRIFSSGHIINDNFYIIGGNPFQGTIADTLPYIIEFALSNLEVTYRSENFYLSEGLPDQQMSEVIDNNIYIFGGVYNSISQDIYKFNIITHSYEKLNITLLEPRAGGCAVYDPFFDQIYIIGGYNENSKALNTVEIFKVQGDKYTIEQGSPLREARNFFMAGYANNTIYVMGGKNNEDKEIETIEMLYNEATANTENRFDEKKLDKFHLYQNYPNPFNPSTTIKFEVPSAKYNELQLIKINLYDVIGNLIVQLINDYFQPGLYHIEFNASSSNKKIPSGVYYYQMKSSNFTETKKMIILK